MLRRPTKKWCNGLSGLNKHYRVMLCLSELERFIQNVVMPTAIAEAIKK
jgi:hypothetical protein